MTAYIVGHRTRVWPRRRPQVLWYGEQLGLIVSHLKPQDALRFTSEAAARRAARAQRWTEIVVKAVRK